MTLAQVLQLYAPLVGLLGLAFWSGVLTNKVTNQKEDLEEVKETVESLKTVLALPNVNVERLVRVETKVDALDPRLAAIDRTLQGIQRQVANSMKTSP